MPSIKSSVVMLAAVLGCGTVQSLKAGDFDAYRQSNVVAEIGSRPRFLVDQLTEGVLKDKLQSCQTRVFRKTRFSIGHRGAPMRFPEHTLESYVAAVRQGAGIVECDVTFTRDAALVCRHAQCDLHTTTDILATPLAAKCSEPFTPASYDANGKLLTPASARCCTSDITLAEFRTLRGKMDGANRAATTVEEYLADTPAWRTALYSGATHGTLMTHAESIELFKALGVEMTPELKAPSVPMPFDTDGDGQGDYTQQDYAQQMIDEYKTAGVRPRDVWAQSFQIDDLRYWIAKEPAFGGQAVYLDDASNPSELPDAHELSSYKAEGINYVAPPMWALVMTLGDDIVPSSYAVDAKAAGLKLITWTLERSASLGGGNAGWYYQTTHGVLSNDGDILRILDVLAKDVGVDGIFSDWPATVTYYANCMGL